MIQEKTFREDLFYRLNVVPITIPSLRERCVDIPLLVEHFMKLFCERHHRAVKQLSAAAMQVLIDYRWPGNVRQLRNVIERLVVTVSTLVIEPAELPVELTATVRRRTSMLQTLSEATEQAEIAAIEAALAQCDFHREQSAKMLDISLRTLHYKMSRYGLH